jgi:hypothetical protein
VDVVKPDDREGIWRKPFRIRIQEKPTGDTTFAKVGSRVRISFPRYGFHPHKARHGWSNHFAYGPTPRARSRVADL